MQVNIYDDLNSVKCLSDFLLRIKVPPVTAAVCNIHYINEKKVLMNNHSSFITQSFCFTAFSFQNFFKAWNVSAFSCVVRCYQKALTSF